MTIAERIVCMVEDPDGRTLNPNKITFTMVPDYGLRIRAQWTCPETGKWLRCDRMMTTPNDRNIEDALRALMVEMGIKDKEEKP